MRWNLKKAGCREHTNLRANLRSDEQKSHIRFCLRVCKSVSFLSPEMEQASKIDGCNQIQAMIKVLIPVIILLMCIEKHLVSGLTSGGVKG